MPKIRVCFFLFLFFLPRELYRQSSRSNTSHPPPSAWSPVSLSFGLVIRSWLLSEPMTASTRRVGHLSTRLGGGAAVGAEVWSPKRPGLLACASFVLTSRVQGKMPVLAVTYHPNGYSSHTSSTPPATLKSVTPFFSSRVLEHGNS